LVPPNKDKVTFYSMVNSKGPLDPFTLNSDVFEQFYVDAAVGCKYENSPQACQTLANLCVLQLYNEQTTACQLFKTIVRDEETQSDLRTQFNDANLKESLPWLYYAQSPKDVLMDPIDVTVSFSDSDDVSQYLNYYIARYTIAGEFLGFQELKTQLSICAIGYQEVIAMKRFGVVTENICEYELAGLTGGSFDLLPKDANAFYELYV
jgi:hypothetical protein